MIEWKDIPGYEGLYQASSDGNIRTVEGKVTSSARFPVRHWKSRVMKGRGDSYSPGKRVTLWKNGGKKEFLVARLVATTFLGDPPEGYTVNHMDGNRMNNRVDNLEWLSIGDNIRHAFENDLIHTQKPVYISVDGTEKRFRSMSQLDLFLGRHKGYVSGVVKNNRKLTDRGGNVYTYRLGYTK